MCAGVLVLETLENALQRGQTPLAEVAGFGASGDAHHVAQPPPDGGGAVLAMRRALRDACLSAAHVAYVNAHATSTPLGDATELEALGTVRPWPCNMVVLSRKPKRSERVDLNPNQKQAGSLCAGSCVHCTSVWCKPSFLGAKGCQLKSARCFTFSTRYTCTRQRTAPRAHTCSEIHADIITLSSCTAPTGVLFLLEVACLIGSVP